MVYIDNELRLDNAGYIKTYTDSDDIKISKLLLYFSVNSGSIPVEDFGNNLYNIVLSSRSETLINSVMEKILKNISEYVSVDNCYYNIENNEVNFIFIVRNNEIKIKGVINAD